MNDIEEALEELEAIGRELDSAKLLSLSDQVKRVADLIARCRRVTPWHEAVNDPFDSIPSTPPNVPIG